MYVVFGSITAFSTTAIPTLTPDTFTKPHIMHHAPITLTAKDRGTHTCPTRHTSPDIDIGRYTTKRKIDNTDSGIDTRGRDTYTNPDRATDKDRQRHRLSHSYTYGPMHTETVG